MTHKKGDITLTTIIIAILVILVLVVLIIVFTKGMGTFGSGTGSCESRGGVGCSDSCDSVTGCEDGCAKIPGIKECTKANTKFCCIPVGKSDK